MNSLLFAALPASMKRRAIQKSWERYTIPDLDPAPDTKSRSQWQRRLWWTGVDKKARDKMVAVDNAFMDAHDDVGETLKGVLVELHHTKGYLSGSDITTAVESAMDAVLDTLEDTYRQSFTDISDRARHQALEKAGVDPVVARTAELLRYARKAVAEDDFKDRIRDNYKESLNRVKSLPQDVVDMLRERLAQSLVTGADTRQVLRAVIGELIDKIDPDGTMPSEAVAEAVGQIWEQTKPLLQRVVRTESINNYSKAQLQEWYNQGIRQVTRHSINDPVTCAKCRLLSTPGNNVYDIVKLLALEHPVTEDPNNPGSFLTHPNCRCWFRPIMGDVWGEVEQLQSELFSDMRGVSVYVSDVPIDAQEQVGAVLKEWNKTADDVEAEFQFVEDPTKDPQWQKWRLEELQRENPTNAMEILEDEIRQGVVVEFTDPETGVTYISGDAKDIDYISKPFIRRQAEVRWDEGGRELSDWWKKRYNQKMSESEMTLEKNGIQIIGGLPFFVQAAGASAKDYFIEAYTAYVVDPVLIRTLDPPAYERLRDDVFSGVEYVQRGGVK